MRLYDGVAFRIERHGADERPAALVQNAHKLRANAGSVVDGPKTVR